VSRKKKRVEPYLSIKGCFKVNEKERQIEIITIKKSPGIHAGALAIIILRNGPAVIRPFIAVY
jgi:hypothetical protein